jgi:hypothetical protein
VCHERSKQRRARHNRPGAPLLRCCAGDGGRPSVAALQEEATNHPKVRRSRAARAERWGKRRATEHVRYDPMKTSESEPLLKCRKRLDDIETRSGGEPWDELGMEPVLLPKRCPAWRWRERGSGSRTEHGNLSSRGREAHGL